MAAYPVYNSVYEVRVPTQPELEELFEILTQRPDSSELDHILYQLGFSSDVAATLRQDRDVLIKSVETLGQTLHKTKDDMLEHMVKIYQFIDQDIVENTLDMGTLLKLSLQPELVRRLERQYKLPETGNIQDMLANYRRTHYTRQCVGYLDPRECLITAAEKGHFDVIKAAVKSLPAESRQDSLDRAMSYAASGGYLDIVKFLVDQGATDFNIALIWAAGEGHLEIVNFLIQRGANKFDTALEAAAENGHLDLVKYLITKVEPGERYNALVYAAGGGHLDVVEYIDDRINDPIRDIRARRRAFNAAVDNGESAVVQYILQYVLEDVKSLNNALMRAASVDMVKTLIDGGANDINARFVAAVRDGEIDIFQYLLTQGANAYNEALRVAVVQFNLEAAQQLLNIHQYTVDELSECLGLLLLELIIDPGAIKSETKRDIITTIKMLSERGGKLDKDKIYDLVYDANLDLIKLFLDIGAADPNEVLKAAASEGSIIMVKLAVAAGATDFEEARYMVPPEKRYNALEKYLRQL